MPEKLGAPAPRLSPAELTLLSRQNAATARVAREAGCPGVASRAARRAVFYRDRRAAATAPERAERRRGRAA
jgi:hypothetical protein